MCISDVSNLCKPCAAAPDCKGLGGADDVCVAYGDEGSFCGASCDSAGAEGCPWGFSCEEAETVDGISTTQCVADAGVCPCTEKSVALALWTSCAMENDDGVCAGKRVCTEDGLAPCDALVPVAEICNGEDDDCDGDVDEPLEVAGAYVPLCDDGNPGRRTKVRLPARERFACPPTSPSTVTPPPTAASPFGPPLEILIIFGRSNLTHLCRSQALRDVYSPRRGARRSSAQLSRWFIMGRCASQHVTEQKNSPVRLRLQVETLHTQ